MQINYINELNIDTTAYESLIDSIFKHINDDKVFNIIFVSKDDIQRINREYRNIDRVTDVISFALCDNDECNFFEEDEEELGDIFICIDRAIEQASDYGHSVEREVGFLAVHGYLHLCGYDHMTEEDEKVMFARQEEILNKANLKRG